MCVRHPVRYPRARTPLLMVCAICAVWACCIVLATPRVFLGIKAHLPPMVRLHSYCRILQERDELSDPEQNGCSCAMLHNAYRLFSSLLSFYFPLTLIILMYIQIFRCVLRRCSAVSARVCTCVVEQVDARASAHVRPAAAADE